MGALIGLGVGIGILLIGLALTTNPPMRVRGNSRVARLIQSAAVPNVTPKSFYSATVISAVVIGALILVIFAVPMVAVMSAVAGAFIPYMILKRRAKMRVKALRTSWPDAVDTLSSAVRAGMSLPEALADLSKRGPIELRHSFSYFADSYRATGSFSSSLVVLQKQMSDPVADRVIAALRIAQDVGGTDLGQVLRTLSALLRQDATTRGDIEARQSWTVSAARMSIAAPWLTLALLCTRPEAVAAFSTVLGAVVLLGAAVVSFIAYRLMIRLGRLPSEERVIGVAV
jgi:tight adherence protein B